MRFLGFALVTASIALSAGGVVYRRPALAQQVASEPAPIAEEQEICRVQTPQTGVRRARIAAPAASDRIVSLGTRGFNYSRPGDPVPTEIRPSADAPAAAPE